MVDSVKTLEGSGRLAVVVVTYGNGTVVDALLELGDLATEAGFSVVA
ncbi:hypothetical protein KIPB_014676, partial [Kipferlia bialata]|eukprot:g14676.t1